MAELNRTEARQNTMRNSDDGNLCKHVVTVDFSNLPNAVNDTVVLARVPAGVVIHGVELFGTTGAAGQMRIGYQPDGGTLTDDQFLGDSPLNAATGAASDMAPVTLTERGSLIGTIKAAAADNVVTVVVEYVYVSV